MKVYFANQSSVEVQGYRYEMVYGATSKMYKEIGICIHLSPQDARTPLSAIQLVDTTEAPSLIKSAVQAIATFLAPNLTKLSITNVKGSLDLLVLPHALRIGTTNAFDPNPLFPAYGGVCQHLRALNPGLESATQISKGTQSSAKELKMEPVSIENTILMRANGSQEGTTTPASIETNYVAIASQIYQTVFPSVRVPTYTALVGDFISYIVAEIKRASNVGIAATIPVVPGVAWLSSVTAQNVLRNLQQNPFRYQGICSQICTKWNVVAESLGTDIPKWPNTALLQNHKTTQARNIAIL